MTWNIDKAQQHFQESGATMNRASRLVSFQFLGLALVGLAACGGPATTEPHLTDPAQGEGGKAPARESAQPEDRAPQASSDQTILPGQRVGPVTSDTSREELAHIYGEDSLQDQPIAMGEGTTEPGTLVDLGPDRQFAIVWRDQSQTQPLLAKDFGNGWQTPEGLGVGVPYATVKSVLGNFQLYGFAWDYEGSLVLEGSNLDQYYGDLLLRVRPSEAAVKAHPNAYQAVTGDVLYPGDDPNLEPLDIQIYEMTVYLNPLTE
jgi:hypothetical protein